MPTDDITHLFPMEKEALLLLDILRRIQKIDPEFPLHYMICLIEVARDEGCSVSALAERTNLALSTVSRIVGALSEYRQMGKPYQLIEARISPVERRRKELYLTSEGRDILSTILQPLEKSV